VTTTEQIQVAQTGRDFAAEICCVIEELTESGDICEAVADRLYRVIRGRSMELFPLPGDTQNIEVAE